MARTALTIDYVNVGLSSLLLNFVNLTSKWCLFHLDNSCFGMILSDYNTAFSIHPLIGRYKLVGLYLVLILYAWCWTFFFLHFLCIGQYFLVYTYMEVLDFLLKYVLIVFANYCENIFCTTISYFNWVAIEYFMQLVSFWKTFI